MNQRSNSNYAHLLIGARPDTKGKGIGVDGVDRRRREAVTNERREAKELGMSVKQCRKEVAL